MKKTLLFLIVSVMFITTLSACTPNDGGIGQSQLWLELSLEEGEAWADDDGRYYVLVDYANDNYEFNQFNSDGKLVRKNGVTRNFKYKGNGTYTFTVDYPAEGSLEAISKDVTIIFEEMAQHNVRIQMYDYYGDDVGIQPVSKVRMLNEEDVINELWDTLAAYNSWSETTKGVEDRAYARFLNKEGKRYIVYARLMTEIWEEEEVQYAVLNEDGSVLFKMNNCLLFVSKSADTIAYTFSTDSELFKSAQYYYDYMSFLSKEQLYELINGTWESSANKDSFTFSVEGGSYYITYTDAKGKNTKAKITDAWVERYDYTFELSNNRIISLTTVFDAENLAELAIEAYNTDGYYTRKK